MQTLPEQKGTNLSLLITSFRFPEDTIFILCRITPATGLLGTSGLGTTALILAPCESAVEEIPVALRAPSISSLFN